MNEEEVEARLSYADLIPLMKATMMQFSSGAAIMPERQMLPIEPEQRYLGIMPVALPHAMGAKLVTFYPKNSAARIPTHNAMIALLDVEHGHPLAFISGRLITEMRTAALSAAVSSVLAKPDSQVLGIVGSGVQAKAHLEALRHLFKFTEVRVWSPTKAHAEAFAEENGAKSLPLDQTVSGADIVVVATNSTQPVLRGAWLKPGAHVNSVGSPRPNWRELDDDVMRNVIVVDSRSAVALEAGDIILSKAKITAEAGEVFSGKIAIDPSRTTLFKSVGLGVQDIATAHFLYERTRNGAGK
jgi:Predicted ornithine cyclodeaminase, mu-crystallin homolog